MNKAQQLISLFEEECTVEAHSFNAGQRLNVDWDGPCQVEITNVGPTKISLVRVVKGKLSDKEEDFIIVTPVELKGMIRK